MFNLRYCATQDKYTRKNRNQSFHLHLSRINVVNFIDGPERKKEKKKIRKREFQGYEVYVPDTDIGRECV